MLPCVPPDPETDVAATGSRSSICTFKVPSIQRVLLARDRSPCDWGPCVTLPRRLYKYRSLSPEDQFRRTERIFSRSRMYFAAAVDFNDPFECRVSLSMEGDEATRRTFIRDRLSRYQPGLSPSQQEALTEQLIRNPPDSEKGRRDAEDDIKKNAAMLSLSERRDDILMWSHYAASHTGICIGFEVASGDGFFSNANPVRYKADFPRMRFYYGSDDRMVEASVFTKSRIWVHEKEWRVAQPPPPGERDFPAHLLCEVVLGTLISPEHRAAVLAWARRRPRPVEVMQARRSERSYTLAIEPITL